MVLRWKKLSKKNTSHVTDHFTQIIPEFGVGFSTSKLWRPRARTGVIGNGRHGLLCQNSVGRSGLFPQKSAETVKNAP